MRLAPRSTIAAQSSSRADSSRASTSQSPLCTLVVDASPLPLVDCRHAPARSDPSLSWSTIQIGSPRPNALHQQLSHSWVMNGVPASSASPSQSATSGPSSGYVRIMPFDRLLSASCGTQDQRGWGSDAVVSNALSLARILAKAERCQYEQSPITRPLLLRWARAARTGARRRARGAFSAPLGFGPPSPLLQR